MKPPKIRSSVKQGQDERGIAAVLWFLVRHIEKFFTVGVILVAAGLAWQTCRYQPLSWQPKDLEKWAADAEKAIIEHDGHADFDPPRNYILYAEQIKGRIPAEPYRTNVELQPVLHPGVVPRSGLEVLIAESLRGESVRRVGDSTPEQWQCPAIPEVPAAENNATIWVNLYGTIPLEKQWEICNQTFDNTPEVNKPKYIYYEWERAKIKENEELVWQPVIVYPGYPESESSPNQPPDFVPNRLIPLEKLQDSLHAGELLLFSDFDVSPATTYVYRMRLYLVNPNYNLQTASVRDGVDTASPFVRSDWSHIVKVYVPDRTLVRVRLVIPPDSADFPRQTLPWWSPRGTMSLNYFDVEWGLMLPAVEKTNMLRGAVCNMSKKEANDYINRDKLSNEKVNLNFPDAGLRPYVCVLDFIGGRKLQKRSSRETPDLTVPGKALLLMPDGSMRISTAE